jgi:16S rRNA G527 N7-methylase RsmG
MVLALLCPLASFTLAEARFRKIAFLKRIKKLTGAGNVDFFEGGLRKEDAANLGPFTRVTSRATAKAERIMSLGRHFLSEKGVLIIMGGRGEGLSSGDIAFDRVIPYTLPGGFGKRKMCLYKKR